MSFAPSIALLGGGLTSPTFEWRKAMKCSASTCVEVRMDPDLIWVRDSKENHLGQGPAGEQAQPMLSAGRREWLVFLTEVLGETAAGTNGSLLFSVVSGGDVVLTGANSDVSLRYDADEWEAFAEGVADGDFGPVASAA